MHRKSTFLPQNCGNLDVLTSKSLVYYPKPAVVLTNFPGVVSNSFGDRSNFPGDDSNSSGDDSNSFGERSKSSGDVSNFLGVASNSSGDFSNSFGVASKSLGDSPKPIAALNGISSGLEDSGVKKIM